MPSTWIITNINKLLVCFLELCHFINFMRDNSMLIWVAFVYGKYIFQLMNKNVSMHTRFDSYRVHCSFGLLQSFQQSTKQPKLYRPNLSGTVIDTNMLVSEFNVHVYVSSLCTNNCWMNDRIVMFLFFICFHYHISGVASESERWFEIILTLKQNFIVKY